MNHIQHVFLIKLIGTVLCVTTVNAETQSSILHSIPLSQNAKLVVMREPLVKANSVKDLLPVKKVTSALGYFNISAEVRPTEGPALRLWSQKCAVNHEGGYDEFRVLDLLVIPGHVVMVLTSEGGDIHPIDIALQGSSRGTSLRGADWSLVAAAPAGLPDRLGAKLRYDEQEQRIEIEVTDFLDGIKQHTLFHQKQTLWDFERIKGWQEEIPATRPEE
jgi:hypothetical protein